MFNLKPAALMAGRLYFRTVGFAPEQHAQQKYWQECSATTCLGKWKCDCLVGCIHDAQTICSAVLADQLSRKRQLHIRSGACASDVVALTLQSRQCHPCCTASSLQPAVLLSPQPFPGHVAHPEGTIRYIMLVGIWQGSPARCSCRAWASWYIVKYQRAVLKQALAQKSRTECT